MLRILNISKVLRMLIIVLSTLFLLTACSPNDDADDKSPVPKGDSANIQEEADESQSQCWQAAIVKVLYEAMGKATMEMYGKITLGALTLMMIAFAIWFAHRLMIHVSSFTEESIGEVWKEVLNKFFVCFCCGYLASSPEMMLWVLNTLLFPLYNAFLEFGSAILANSNAGSGGYSDVLGDNVEFKQSLICTVKGSTKANLEAGFPTGPQEMMGCMICSISERLGVGRRMAFNVLTDSNSKFLGWIVGIVVFCCFTFVRLGFVFYLVDTIFRMAVMMVILPLLVMSFAFKKTRDWTKKGFFIILNSAAFAAFIAILMTSALLAMEEIFLKNQDIFGNQTNANNELNELSVVFICILLICFLLVSTVGVAAQVSGALVGGKADPKFQKKLKVVLEMVAGWLTGGLSKGFKRIASAAKAAKK